MESNYQNHFSHFLTKNKGKLHFACHSHHYWPDVTREAHLQSWEDSCEFVDEKWDHIFSKKVPQAQKLIANVLNLSKPEQIVFAPNTHEFVARLLSCFDYRKPIKVLTTDSEFYSFDRQIERVSEIETFDITKVETRPFSDFSQRFIQKIQQGDYDLIFFSHVFFNSGFVVENYLEIVEAAQSSKAMIVIDGYHGFMALPTDMSSIEDRAFYLAGAYKYAQAGEGSCFMHVPSGTKLRPQNTGWFAQFGSLSGETKGVPYASDGMRFAGATMDFSALYRLVSVLELYEKEKLSVAETHKYVLDLQGYFLERVEHELLTAEKLLTNELSERGHFLTYEMPSEEKTQEISKALRDEGVLVDSRKNRLRFGFAIYQTKEWVDQLVEILKKI